MFLITSKYLLPKGYRGITLYPLVILKHKEDAADAVLLNHEKIHIRQQVELLILPFFIWYLLAYLYNLVKFRCHKKAYRNVLFEREAYANERNLDYLAKRPLWNFLKIK